MDDPKKRAGKVLLVDDQALVAEAIRRCLHDEPGLEFHYCSDPAKAIALANQINPSVILQDLVMPGIDGLTVVEQFRANPSTKETPIIVLSTKEEPTIKARAFEIGANDYIVKLPDKIELLARIRYHSKVHAAQIQLVENNQQLVSLNSKLEAATNAKSEFLASMSHEIRTPMNGVIGMTDLLLASDLTEEQKAFAQTIKSSGQALLFILNDILDFSKIESGKLELEQQPFVLTEAIEETLSLLAPQAAARSIEMAYEIDEPGVPDRVVGDIVRLRQMLLNLAGNALKFTHEGEVLITVRLDAEKPGTHIHFSVRDTGIGIPADKIDRLFKSFSQVDSSTTRQYGGTGLGLAICQRLSALMNGRIWVESVSGKGSTFHFSIALPAAPSQPGDKVAPITRKKLLVAQTNPATARMITREIEAAGGLARCVFTAKAALSALLDEKFDAALVAFQFPDMEGTQLIRCIRALPQYARLPLAGLSRLAVPAEENTLRLEGVPLLIRKPLRRSEVRQILIPWLANPEVVAKNRPAPDNRPPNLADRFPLRILVADDNSVNQTVALRMLQKFGYHAACVDNGQEAFDILGNQKYDIVFMDGQMPVMSGFEATRQIRLREQSGAISRTVIIAMTANVLEADQRKCLEAGMDDYLQKPVQMASLQKVLAQWGEKLHGPSAGVTDSPVDLTRLFHLVDYDKTGFKDLVATYTRKTREQLDKLQEAITAGQSEEVKNIAHSCLGSSSMCGMKEISSTLRKLEEAGETSDLSRAPALLAQCETQFTDLQKTLNEANIPTRPSS